MKYFFLFLLLAYPVTATEIGVSPASLDLTSQKELYVFNLGNQSLLLTLTSSLVDFSEEEITLLPQEKRLVLLERKKDGEGYVQVRTQQQVGPGLLIPITVHTLTPEQEEVLQGIYGLVLINLIGAIIIGVLVWKKRRSSS